MDSAGSSSSPSQQCATDPPVLISTATESDPLIPKLTTKRPSSALLRRAVTKLTLASPKPLNRREVVPLSQIYGVVLPVSLLALGVVAFRFAEGWPLSTSLYVIVQIITTVGYGDFTVGFWGTKVFMGFYVIALLVVVAYYFNILTSRLLEKEAEALKTHLAEIESHGSGNAGAEKYAALNTVIAASISFVIVLLTGMLFFRFAEHCVCKGLANCDDSRGFEVCAATGGKVKGWSEAFYMSAITLTTIGLGDYEPLTGQGRFFCMFWMLIGVAATGNFLNSLSSYFFDAESKAFYSMTDNIENISEDQFKAMDADGNGTLSKGEFLAFSLVKYTGVPQEVVDSVLKEFATIDKNSTNRVTYDMFMEHQKELAWKRSQAQDKRLPSDLLPQTDVSA